MITFLTIILILILYFIPTIIAKINKHKSIMSIFLINLFLGWTFVIWIIIFIYAHFNKNEFIQL